LSEKLSRLIAIAELMMASRRSLFVSYHHKIDQAYYDAFSHSFENIYGIIRDNSLDRRIESDDPEYVRQRIRERHITGTSCTIVLCGPETYKRKYVDWEIKATLDKEHGLIGVNLPHNPRNIYGNCFVPNRLYDNIISGYALMIQWNDIENNPTALKKYVELAIAMSPRLIDNSRPMFWRNRS